MLRGVIQFTKEELFEIKKSFNSEVHSQSAIGTKLKFVLDTDKKVYDIEVSEDDLEILLDDIMPVSPSNVVLSVAMEKVGNLLRQFRDSNSQENEY